MRRAGPGRPRDSAAGARAPLLHAPAGAERILKLVATQPWAKAELERVRAEVERLPDALREPFVLFRFEGLPMKEIAGILEISPKAVETRLARALRRVSERLKELRAAYGDARLRESG